MKLYAIVLLVTLMASAAIGQTQVTAETMDFDATTGKPKEAVFTSSNALVVKDFTILTVTTVQYWRALTKRIDGFAGATLTTAFGKKQASVTGGVLTNLLKSKIVSVAAFNTLSTPLHRRK